MIEWYKSDKLSIYFDTIPQVAVRSILPTFTKEEKQSVKKYPFICKNTLHVKISDNKNGCDYEFTIPKGYCYDGASIPRIFWRIIGSNTDNQFLIPALIHDVLCENHQYINNNRHFSTEIFNALLEVSDVFCLKRFFMKYSVDSFQKLFCKW